MLTLFRQPSLAQRADHLLAIGGLKSHELVECVSLTDRHRRIHYQKRRDMLLGFVDAPEKGQGVGEIELR